MILLVDSTLALTWKLVRTLTIGEIDRRIQNTEIKKYEIRTLGFKQYNDVVSEY